ncbi:hypothetical protein BWD162_008870 [Bartonella sp. WD16.2]|nr:hypothetical protein BWD162_008870 [Bartonella sp. WD16.2]
MKKRKKRGRPRIEGQKREPNGRISRAKTTDKSLYQQTLKMRAKRYGASIQDAKNPIIGTYVGRLYLLEKRLIKISMMHHSSIFRCETIIRVRKDCRGLIMMVPMTITIKTVLRSELK